MHINVNEIKGVPLLGATLVKQKLKAAFMHFGWVGGGGMSLATWGQQNKHFSHYCFIKMLKCTVVVG